MTLPHPQSASVARRRRVGWMAGPSSPSSSSPTSSASRVGRVGAQLPGSSSVMAAACRRARRARACGRARARTPGARWCDGASALRVVAAWGERGGDDGGGAVDDRDEFTVSEHDSVLLYGLPTLTRTLRSRRRRRKRGPSGLPAPDRRADAVSELTISSMAFGTERMPGLLHPLLHRVAIKTAADKEEEEGGLPDGVSLVSVVEEDGGGRAEPAAVEAEGGAPAATRTAGARRTIWRNDLSFSYLGVDQVFRYKLVTGSPGGGAGAGAGGDDGHGAGEKVEIEGEDGIAFLLKKKRSDIVLMLCEVLAELHMFSEDIRQCRLKVVGEGNAVTEVVGDAALLREMATAAAEYRTGTLTSPPRPGGPPRADDLLSPSTSAEDDAGGGQGTGARIVRRGRWYPPSGGAAVRFCALQVAAADDLGGAGRPALMHRMQIRAPSEDDADGAAARGAARWKIIRSGLSIEASSPSSFPSDAQTSSHPPRPWYTVDLSDDEFRSVTELLDYLLEDATILPDVVLTYPAPNAGVSAAASAPLEGAQEHGAASASAAGSTAQQLARSRRRMDDGGHTSASPTLPLSRLPSGIGEGPASAGGLLRTLLLGGLACAAGVFFARGWTGRGATDAAAPVIGSVAFMQGSSSAGAAGPAPIEVATLNKAELVRAKAAIVRWVGPPSSWPSGRGGLQVQSRFAAGGGRMADRMRFQLTMDLSEGEVVGLAPCDELAVQLYTTMPLLEDLEKYRSRCRRRRIGFGEDLRRVAVFCVAVDLGRDTVQVERWDERMPLLGKIEDQK